MLSCPICKSPLEPVVPRPGSCSICGSVFLADLQPIDTRPADSGEPKIVGPGGTTFDNRHIRATLDSSFVPTVEPTRAHGSTPAPRPTDQTLDSTPLPPGVLDAHDRFPVAPIRRCRAHDRFHPATARWSRADDRFRPAAGGGGRRAGGANARRDGSIDADVVEPDWSGGRCRHVAQGGRAPEDAPRFEAGDQNPRAARSSATCPRAKAITNCWRCWAKAAWASSIPARQARSIARSRSKCSRRTSPATRTSGKNFCPKRSSPAISTTRTSCRSTIWAPTRRVPCSIR